LWARIVVSGPRTTKSVHRSTGDGGGAGDPLDSGRHLDTLLAKEAAGANLAISQLFFHADDYLRFVDQARAAGGA